ncbi:hypothetical protein [Sinorhizobium meliloti]|uniref:hypothetical protein n=1 Tax=Rhizobium meliloti TaxID=382 RepID=UPI001F379E3F|nr:hypothetical protein [Sinorhizobium meliloti]
MQTPLNRGRDHPGNRGRNHLGTKGRLHRNRHVKAWRMEMAVLVILDGGWIKSLPSAAAAAVDTGTSASAVLGNILR